MSADVIVSGWLYVFFEAGGRAAGVAIFTGFVIAEALRAVAVAFRQGAWQILAVLYIVLVDSQFLVVGRTGTGALFELNGQVYPLTPVHPFHNKTASRNS